ncbi:hypothetical protein SAMD00019534_094670 [Acytostelium subglobosum LB1]|uniref:hypothetical protein n=1 Tax=Acytostelium subglobosum LB1 TaxID=1410327 RepID=UPI0006450ED1|nr:hypothetical protein SAMD00019534_094670 [Acytostelium subglobosum LB1]GAM26292.1 hypothetical protein SAMD00019534_094670 [Acytostelium subglobosum LB1]|eukprot:XP_012750846.1 hypothetical protein SAMD00019534_094670 [Acytostelium subglobosum LB1]
MTISGNNKINLFGLNVTINGDVGGNGVVIDSGISGPLDFIQLQKVSGNGIVPVPTTQTLITLNNITMINVQVTSVDIEYVTLVLNNVSINSNDSVGSRSFTPITITPPQYTTSPSTSRLTINGGVISNVPSSDNVSVIFTSQCDLIINGTQFINNTGYSMISVHNGTLSISDSTMFNNTFINNLIDIGYSRVSSTINNCTFTDNTLTNSVMEQHEGWLTITSSLMSGNSDLHNVIELNDGVVMIQNTTISDNFIMSNGSSINGNGITLNMINCSLTDNQYQVASIPLWFNGSYVTITDVVFSTPVDTGNISIIDCHSGNITFNNITNNYIGHQLINCEILDLCKIYYGNDDHDQSETLCPVAPPWRGGGGGRGLGGGAIAGIVIGSIVGASIIIFAVAMIFKKYYITRKDIDMRYMEHKDNLY